MVDDIKTILLSDMTTTKPRFLKIVPSFYLLCTV